MDKLFALIPKPLVTSMYFFYRSLSLSVCLERSEDERKIENSAEREQNKTSDQL